jgi:uncharacterized protein YqfA (UPF0365 family)
MIESLGTWGLIIGVIVLLFIILYFIPIGLWFSALVSGVRISLLQLFLMRFRKVPPGVIVRALIEGTKADVPLSRDDLEAHYLAGGHVARVVHALVSAAKANIELPFNMATAIDLAGRDVFEAVQMSVNSSGYGRFKRWYSADSKSTGNRSCQHKTIGWRSRRRNRSCPCR